MFCFRLNVRSDPCVRAVHTKVKCSYCQEVKEQWSNFFTDYSCTHYFHSLSFSRKVTQRGLAKSENLGFQGWLQCSHDNTEFWNHVDLQKLRADNSHDDVSDSDSDDDADDDDDNNDQEKK